MSIQIQNEINLIKDSILQVVPAEAIYLFGSYAYGTPSEASDLDVYVVVPDDVEDLSELYADIQSLLRKKTLFPMDLIVNRSRVFNRRKNGPTLEGVINRKGALVYGI
ncbi:MAG: nucleotidyltransferase domain-containing protein [Defluviitaleaceae bacterium]|nr:nucleotidyltransferase domain-containing protein [Defluviitaleaceae bacterium]